MRRAFLLFVPFLGQGLRLESLTFFSESVTSQSWVPRLTAPSPLRAGGSCAKGASAVPRKLFCYARQNFPKERVKTRNAFSNDEKSKRQNNERKIKNENKNHHQIPFSETGVSASAAVYSLDADWYQILTRASCDRLKNSAWQSGAAYQPQQCNCDPKES